jgi:hypothetical protein
MSLDTSLAKYIDVESSELSTTYFYKKHPELVRGQANRLADIRVTAHTPAAIKDWFHRIITGEGSKDKFYGMNPKGMEQYLIEQMPHICAEHDDDPSGSKPGRRPCAMTRGRRQTLIR